jgi:hypothetical protein
MPVESPSVELVSELTTECPRCHMRVTARDRRVADIAALYHFECYNAWHFAAYGRYPRLRVRLRGDRKQYEVRHESPSIRIPPGLRLG